MLTYNDQTKARFPLSLDGRGVRGEGVASFGKAGLLLATCLLYLAPAPAALAQGECGLQSDPGNPETVTCPPGDYPGGITYDSLGDLTLEVPDDEVDLRLLDDGASVTGIGGDNIFWDSSAFVSGQIAGDASDPDNNPGTFDGSVLDYLSDTGNVDILVGGDIKGLDSASHAIRAESAGGGNVSVTTLGDVNVRAGFGDPDPSGIGIEALTTTGDIAITTSGRVESGRAGGLYAIHADSSAGGNIEIVADDSIRGSGGASHGILAETTGAGAITLDTGSVGVAAFNNPNAVAGIEAVTDSGNIVIATGDSNVSGANGVIARTGGSGTIDIDVGRANGDARGGKPDVAAIRAIAGSGDITISSSRIEMQGGGTAVVTHTDGLATIDLVSEFTGIAGFGVTNAFTGATMAIRSSGGSVLANFSGPPPVLTGTDQKAGQAMENYLRRRSIAAPFDFSGLSGNAELNFVGSPWMVTDPNHSGTNAFITERSVFSPGDDVVNIAADAFLTTPLLGGNTAFLSATPTVEADRFIVEFGAGQDVVNNAGTVLVAPNDNALALSVRTGYEGELRLNGLAEFNNAGTIWFGRTFDFQIAGRNETDSWPDDMLSVPGATFHGEPGNRIIADVDLGRVGQESCTFAARNADGDLLADCINIENGAATGRSLFEIRQMVPGDRGAYNPDGIVLVDLSGDDTDISATDPDAFGIHPDSRDYSPAQGGILDKGLFFYTIALDPNQQQFRLYGFPSSGPQQAPLLLQAANQLWRTSTDAWFDRRVDQRDIDRDDLGGSFWIRTSRNEGERDVITPIEAGGETLNFDNSFQQDDTTFTIGTDFISRSAGNSAWVVGGMLGYGRSDIAFDDSPNSAELRGMHAGLYGSFVLDAFFVDVAVNRAWLDMDFDVPAMNLEPETALVRADLETTGAQIEAGWRLDMGRFSVEPLLGYTHVTTEGEDVVEIPASDPARFGGAIATDGDPTSSRGSLGLRLRMDDVAPGIVPVSVGLTARAIEEFDGESKLVVTNTGPIAAETANTFDGTFGQVTGDVSVTNATKTMAGFLKVDGMFHDEYDSLGVSAGFRVQW